MRPSLRAATAVSSTRRRLADPRLTGQEDHRTAAGARALERLLEARAFGSASDERRRIAAREHAARLGGGPRHLPELPRSIDALERDLAAVVELAARGSEYAVHGVGREDPAGGCHALDALREDQRLAVERPVLAQHLAGVKADAELHRGVGRAAVAARDRALDLPGARDRPSGALERDHETVAGVLQQDPAFLLHLLEEDTGELALDGRGSLVAQPLVEQRGPDDIGREHRDRALG